VEAVIDKDRSSALLASRLGMDLFVISTDADCIYLDYKRPTQRPIREIDAAGLQSLMKQGHFPPGNMGPKVESILQFLRASGKEAIVTSCENLQKAVEGLAGTHVLAGHAEAESGLKFNIEVPVGGR